MWWRANVLHLRLYHHFPVWRQFDKTSICERCIKPPSRPNAPRRLTPIPVWE